MSLTAAHRTALVVLMAVAALQGQMHALLAALGKPQQAWPAVHVAGTKGKGSVSAMLSSILHRSGYKVGTYTR